MSLIHNERTKLLANALDRASTACVAVGLIAHSVATMTGTGNGLHLTCVSLLSSGAEILPAVVLHFAARHILGRLQ